MDLHEKIMLAVLNMRLSPADTVAKFKAISGVKAAAAERRHKIDRIQKESALKIKALEDQQLCQHEFVETHGDPSGGSDSEDWCLVCGDCVTRKAVRFT